MQKELTDIALLSLTGAAELMQLGRNTLRLLISEGKIGVIYVGSRIKIPYVELRNFITNNTDYYTNVTGSQPDWAEENTSISGVNFNTDELFDKLKGEKLDG